MERGKTMNLEEYEKKKELIKQIEEDNKIKFPLSSFISAILLLILLYPLYLLTEKFEWFIISVIALMILSRM